MNVTVSPRVHDIESRAARHYQWQQQELGQVDLAVCIRWLKRKGLSYAALGRVLGVTRWTVWYWAHGNMPSKETHGMFIRGFTLSVVKSVQADEQTH